MGSQESFLHNHFQLSYSLSQRKSGVHLFTRPNNWKKTKNKIGTFFKKKPPRRFYLCVLEIGGGGTGVEVTTHTGGPNTYIRRQFLSTHNSENFDFKTGNVIRSNFLRKFPLDFFLFFSKGAGDYFQIFFFFKKDECLSLSIRAIVNPIGFLLENFLRGRKGGSCCW